MATLTNNKLIPCCTRDPEFSIEYDKLAELSGEMVTYDDGDGHFDEIWQPKISDSDLELLDKISFKMFQEF